MSYSFKSILVTALLTFSVSVQASLPNSNIEDSPTPRSSSSLTSPVSLNAPLPIHLKVLNGLLEQVEAEELAGTPDLNSLMDSYSASRGKALPLPVLLYRLTRELERTPSTMQGYDAFFLSKLI